MASDLTVGQRVWVYDVNSARHGADWPREGTVVKVGRTLVHVKCAFYGPEAMTFRDGRRNDDYRHQWIKTDTERAEGGRLARAKATLIAAGVRLEPGCSLSLETIEAMAALLA